MFFSWAQCSLLLTILVTSGCASIAARRDRPAIAESRAVHFLIREVPAWSRDNGCFSCHNNGDGARALYLAKAQSVEVPAVALTDTTDWLKKPDGWDNNKGDAGFSDKRLARIEFANALAEA